MRTLTISISDLEYKKFGIKGDSILFTDFVDLISRELSRQTLESCVQLAEKFELSKLSMDEITNEVNAVRRNATNHH